MINFLNVIINFFNLNNKSLSVSFAICKPFSSSDSRRKILGIVKHEFFINPTQIKFINFTKNAVLKKKIVGNHRHPKNSGQWEVIYVLGDKNIKYFEFRYRNYNGPVKSKFLMGGDTVKIPPGCTLALKPLEFGASVIEISNMEHDPNNYIKDFLF